MRVFKSFKAVTICSVIVSTVCAVLGILISIIGINGKGTPVGSTIVAVDILGFFIFCAAGFISGKGNLSR
jgi:zinc transport system permease protein